jgi:multicomponent Na+:H+ antiporter subunit F
MSLVQNATLALLGVAFLMTTVRLIQGPTVFDRVVALDVLSVLLVSAIIVRSAVQGVATYTPLAMVIALLGFVGSITAARLAGERRGRT